jgi:2-methylcitrate dehydratase
VASDPRVDVLRSRMVVRENTAFTAEYYERTKRYIGNAVQVHFKDGTSTARVQVDYPIGHRRRRAEGMPLLVKKFEDSVRAHYTSAQARRIVSRFADPRALDDMPVDEMMSLLVKPGRDGEEQS